MCGWLSRSASAGSSLFSHTAVQLQALQLLAAGCAAAHDDDDDAPPPVISAAAAGSRWSALDLLMV